MMMRRMTLLLALALMPALGGCNRGADDDVRSGAPTGNPATIDQAVRVTDVELGRAIDAQGRIADNADTDNFSTRDTIYVSVRTEGSAPGARLTARWLFEDGQVVDESSQTIASGGPATTEFHISNPAGFPAGKYRVEIHLDGRVVETEEFEVR